MGNKSAQLPALTEDRRRELVKLSMPAGRVPIAVRNTRRDLHNDMRELEKEKLVSEDDLKRAKMTSRK